jgi:hypothetical protein
MNKITLFGLSTIFLYSIIQICKFYGIETESFKIYVYFYVFVLISTLILPNDNPKL